MDINKFSQLVAKGEKGKVQVNIAQIKEILKVINKRTKGLLYVIIKGFLVVGLVCMASLVKAEPLCTDWGVANLCLPIVSGVTASFGYDFKGDRSQGLAETPFASVSINSDSKIVFTFGAITSDDGKGAPILGFDYRLKGINNPIPGITEIQPGIYGGRDFHLNEDFWGVKASVPILTSSK